MSRLPADWWKRRQRVLRRDGHRCQLRYPGICTVVASHVDHRVAGDDHSLSNLQAACPACHGRKSAVEGVAARAAKQASRKRQPEPHPGLIASDELRRRRRP
jgi:5-methylcytosine-specific restriction enzyme A